jgi:rare lipoprotein A
MDDSKAICAMRHIRLGTLIRVVNVSNGRSATCRVDDRGPYVGDRIIDVSLYVKQKLHMGGLAYVKVYARY